MSASRTARIAHAWGLPAITNLPAPDRAPAAGVDSLPTSAAFSHFTESCPSGGSFGQDEAAPAVNPEPTHMAGAVILSEASAFILSLVAAHQGRDQADIMAQLIAAAGDAIGLSSLLSRGVEHIGDLADVPDFARRASRRFRGVP